MRPEFDPWVGKIPWKNKWQPTPVFWPGKSHGQGAWWIVVRGISQSWTWLKWRSTHCIFTYTNFLLLSLFCNYFLLVDTVLCPVLFFFFLLYYSSGSYLFSPPNSVDYNTNQFDYWWVRRLTEDFFTLQSHLSLRMGLPSGDFCWAISIVCGVGFPAHLHSVSPPEDQPGLVFVMVARFPERERAEAGFNCSLGISLFPWWFVASAGHKADLGSTAEQVACMAQREGTGHVQWPQIEENCI